MNICESFFKDRYSSRMKTDSILPDTDSFFFFFRKERHRFKQRGTWFHWRFINWIWMSQYFERYGTRQKPRNRWILRNVLEWSFQTSASHISQKRDIIKLIPKKSEELYYIKNWRPLTLLKWDYKIATKAIANRLKTHLHKLINNDQTGFLKGKFIGENIRLIDSAINNTAAKKKRKRKKKEKEKKKEERKKLPDFYFSLTLIKRLIHWNGLLYKKHLFLSDLALLLSNLTFLFSQPKKSGKNADTNGLWVKNTEIKLNQYADDTSLILDGWEKSLSEALRILKGFEKLFGLRLNSKKTEALWIGSCADKS